MKQVRYEKLQQQDFPAESPGVNFRQTLPSWGYAEAVAQAADLGEGFVQYTSCCVGPALPLLALSALATFSLQVTFFEVIHETSQCSEEGALTYSPCVWLLPLPVLALRMFAEIRAVRHVSIPYCAKSQFSLFGSEVAFGKWLAAGLLFSTLNLADVCTDSAFSATSLKKLNCQDSGMQETWNTTWEQSIPGLLGVGAPPLSALIFVSWCLSLIQFMVPLMTSFPMPCDEWPSFILGSFGPYRTMMLSDCYYHDALFEIADSSGNASLQGLLVPYIKAQLRSGRFNSISHISRQMMTRMLLSYFLENAVQVNVQVTLFALSRYVNKDHPTLQTTNLISLSISIMGSFLKLLEAKDLFNLGSLTEELYGPSVNDEAVQQIYGRFKWGLLVARFACGLLILSLLYAAVKLIGAFACEDSMLNLTGCAQMHPT